MRMKRIVLLLICVVISIATYADIGDVIRAISQGSNINIQFTGKEVDRSTGEYIGDIVQFNFTPNGSDFDDNRVFGINMVNSNLNFYGHNIVLRKGEVQVKDYVNEIYTFFIVDTDLQPRISLSTMVGNDEVIPVLVLQDGKGGDRAFYIALCKVIGEDGSILLPQGTWIRGSGQGTLKKMLDAIAQTVELE